MKGSKLKKHNVSNVHSIERCVICRVHAVHIHVLYMYVPLKEKRALLFKIDKLMCGSSLEGKAFLRSHKLWNSIRFLLKATQISTSGLPVVAK